MEKSGVASEWERADVREFARLASVQEAECYETTADSNRNKFPRLEETIQFAGKCNYRKIGMASCVGLEQEARMLTDTCLSGCLSLGNDGDGP